MICNNFSVYVKCVCESIKCYSGIPDFGSFQIVKYICVNGMCVIQSNVQFIYYKDYSPGKELPSQCSPFSIYNFFLSFFGAT